MLLELYCKCEHSQQARNVYLSGDTIYPNLARVLPGAQLMFLVCAQDPGRLIYYIQKKT